MSVIVLECGSKQDVYNRLIRFMKGLKGAYRIVYFTVLPPHEFDLLEVVSSPGVIEEGEPPFAPPRLYDKPKENRGPNMHARWLSRDLKKRSIDVFFVPPYPNTSNGQYFDHIFMDGNISEYVWYEIIFPSTLFGRKDIRVFWQKGLPVHPNHLLYRSVTDSFKQTIRMLLMLGRTLKNCRLSLLPLDLVEAICREL